MEEVVSQLRSAPRGQTSAEQMVRLREACIRLSGPVLRDLFRSVMGTIVLTKEQVRAAELIIERAVPKIQHIVTKEEPADQLAKMDEEQVVARIQALVQKDPQLIETLIGGKVINQEMGNEDIDGSIVGDGSDEPGSR